MKPITAIVFLLALMVLPTGTCSAQSEPDLAFKRVLWLGDGITSQGDYVKFVEYFLTKCYPVKSFHIFEIARAGETVSGLSEKTDPTLGARPCVRDRLQRALQETTPEVVVVCYGMNDGLYCPQSPEHLKAFQDGLCKLIEECHSAKADVIVLTPPPFDKATSKSTVKKNALSFGPEKPYEEYDSVLSDYTQWELSALKDKARVIDLHTPMLEYIRHQREANPKFSLASDGIHPNQAGNLLIAERILGELGVKPVGTNADLDKECNVIREDPLFKFVSKDHDIWTKTYLDLVVVPADTDELLRELIQAHADSSHLRVEMDEELMRSEPKPDAATNPKQ